MRNIDQGNGGIFLCILNLDNGVAKRASHPDHSVLRIEPTISLYWRLCGSKHSMVVLEMRSISSASLELTKF
jgi:hypothetical protein